VSGGPVQAPAQGVAFGGHSSTLTLGTIMRNHLASLSPCVPESAPRLRLRGMSGSG
jgi:hypothetical protein